MGCRGRGRGQGHDRTPGYWATFRSEWSPCQDFYFARDPVTDRILDIPESFAPLSALAVIGKVVTALLTMGTYGYSIYKMDHRYFMFAYLTYWVVPLQCMYHLLSVSNSIWASSIEQPEFYVRGRCRLTWYIFNVSMPASIIVCGLWWGTVFDSDDHLSYQMIGVHSVTALMEYIDGFWINRIPIRFNHWWTGLLPFSIAYAIWTFLHGVVFDVGNPDFSDNDATTNDDLLYIDIDWDNDFTYTIVFVAILLFAVGPLVQMILVLLSLYHIPFLCIGDRRRYLDSEHSQDRRPRKQQDEDSLGPSLWY